MARSKNKSRGRQELESDEVALGSRGMEALGVLFLVLSTALIFALFSFNTADRGQGNLVGPVGRTIASVILGGVGAVGYIAAMLGVIGAGAVLLGRARWPSFLSATSALGVTVAATVLAHLVFSGDLVGHPAGGVVGAVLAETLRAWVGPVGAALLAIGVLMVSLIGAADVSFGAVLRDTGRFLSLAVAWLRGRVEAWREAELAGRSREEELWAEHQERQIDAERARLEKQTKLREQLEEKKRAAILKAESKAEERVLARIAAEEAKKRAEEEAQRRAREEAEQKAREEAERRALEEAAAGEGESAPDSEDAEGAEDSEDDTEEVAARGDAESEEDGDAEDAEGGDGGDGEEGAAEDEIDGEAEEPEVSERPARGIVPWKAGDESAAFEDTFVRAGADGGPEIIPARREVVDLSDQPQDRPRGERRARKVYELPPLRLLDYTAPPPLKIDGEDLRGRATRLEEKLRTYGVDGRVVAIRPGPVVTTYEYQPAPGVKVSKIAGLTDDIAMSMAAHSVRIIAPIPGKGVVGIELPNDTRENVYLKELIAHDRFHKAKSLLTLALGKDTEGDTQVRDLGKMPHLLVAGTTGSGKSVSVNAMILSILYKATPDQVKFIMVDPKMLELSLYNDIPHLLLPVVTDAKKASLALQWAVDEMERRYRMLSDFKVRNIEGFNKKLGLLREQRADEESGDIASTPPTSSSSGPLELLDPSALLADDAEVDLDSVRPEDAQDEEDRIDDPWRGQDVPEDLPYIVVLIDEFADLMCVAPRDVEASVQRLAQKARAAGIHLLLATQRPSTDVITGVIKNNFPSRISFRVASRHDSATIINQPGAENLLGMGDMLALGANSPEPLRIHGAYVSEEEVMRVVSFWKAQGRPVFDQAILRPREDEGEGDEDLEAEKDEMYDRAVQIVVETKKASISALQRRLRVGYNRAARMIEVMEKEGIVSAAMGPKGDREVLVREMAVDGPPRV